MEIDLTYIDNTPLGTVSNIVLHWHLQNMEPIYTTGPQERMRSI